MAENGKSCPTLEELELYMVGKLAPAHWELVDEHISTCELCVERMEDLQPADDSFAAAVKSASPCDPSESKSDGESYHRSSFFGEYGESQPKRKVSDSIQAEVTIGPYRVLEFIGKGGMGEVFLAEQSKPFKRKVAIKVVSSETPTKEIIARFDVERQALALMDHENIARIIDAGVTHHGRPYFVMEYVAGVPITDYCDHQQLGVEKRLELYVQACRAIQHAHHKGVIHRDVKPSNVLVSEVNGSPIVKVIDFGLAKAVDDRADIAAKSLFSTQFGQILGTLEYMSPEQAELSQANVDTRTDVYSLGVLLFELLTGTTPLDLERVEKKTFEVILKEIREGESPKPSARISDSTSGPQLVAENRKSDSRRLSKSLQRELDWISKKALEKQRSARYDGPGALADDIGRYLRNEPVEACAPTLVYVMSKIFRKHRASFLVAFAVVISLLLGLTGTTAMWLRARQAEESERRKNVALDEQRKLAVKNLDAAKLAVDTFFTTVSENNLINRPAMSELRLDLLGKALKLYRSFLEKSDANVSTSAELGAAYFRVAQAGFSGNILSLAKAREDFNSGLEILDALLAESPDSIDWAGLDDGIYVGRMRFPTGGTDSIPSFLAVPLLPEARRACEIFEKFHALFPKNVGIKNDLAGMYNIRALIEYSAKKYDMAINSFTRSRSLWNELQEQYPNDLNYKKEIAVSFGNLAKVYREKYDAEGEPANLELAITQQRQSVGLNEEVLSASAEEAFVLDFAASSFDLTNLLKKKGDRQGALDAGMKGLSSLQKHHRCEFETERKKLSALVSSLEEAEQ